MNMFHVKLVFISVRGENLSIFLFIVFLNFKARVSDICSIMVVNDLSCSTAEQEDYMVKADDILLFSVGHSVLYKYPPTSLSFICDTNRVREYFTNNSSRNFQRMDYVNEESFYSDEGNKDLSPEWREKAKELVEENPAER